MKTCARCFITKPFTEFSKGPRYRDGYQSYCKPCMRAYRAEKFSTTEAIRAERDRTRDYYRNTPEARARNRAAGRERDRDKWHNDPEYRARKNAWKRQRFHSDPVYRAHKLMLSVQHRRTRRARLANAEGSFTREEWNLLCERYNHQCVCCGATGALHADHIVPIAKGGTNSIENIQPLCGPCNRRKFTKTQDYRPEQGVK